MAQTTGQSIKGVLLKSLALTCISYTSFGDYKQCGTSYNMNNCISYSFSSSSLIESIMLSYPLLHSALSSAIISVGFTCYLDISFHCLPSPPLSSVSFAGCDSVIGYKLGLSCLFLLQVLLWRTSTFDYVDTAEGHSHLITDVRFRPNSSTFATSSFDKTMQIWDAKKVNLSLSLFI